MKKSAIKRYLPPILLLAAAAAFIAIGASDGEAAAALKKAISVCLECIGLG